MCIKFHDLVIGNGILFLYFMVKEFICYVYRKILKRKERQKKKIYFSKLSFSLEISFSRSFRVFLFYLKFTRKLNKREK